jgi:hypothetical protein
MANRKGLNVQWDRRSVAPSVALALLEVIRALDRPEEVLEDEDLSVTLPRRLGLSGVVEAQILRYRHDVRRGDKVSEGELRDLVHLVIRRPDSEDALRETGRRLAAASSRGAPRRRRYPRRLRMALARRRVGRRLRSLFGGSIVEFGNGPFVLYGKDHLFIAIDPGGDGCALITGLCQQMVERELGEALVVRHTHCKALGDGHCQWTLMEERAEVPIIDLEMLGGDSTPLPEAG